MRLLCEFDDLGGAENLANTLRSKGIAIYISGVNSRAHRVVTGTLKVGLWIILDDQLDAAHKIKNGLRYELKNKLTEQEIIDVEHRMSAANLSSFSESFLNNIFVVIIFIVIVVVGGKIFLSYL
jgi:hypothetical protein